MDGQGQLKVSLENFGPIRKGDFEVRPLTILIGANNSGKSYAALLLYSFLQTFFSRLQMYSFGLEPWSQLQKARKDLSEWLRTEYKPRKRLRVQDLPKDSQRVLVSALDKLEAAHGDDLEKALLRYLSCENLSDLIRSGERGESTSVSFSQGGHDTPFLSLRAGSKQKKASVDWNLPDAGSLRVHAPEMRRFAALADDSMPPELTWLLIYPLWLELLQAVGIVPNQSYYLPAARAGIVQNLSRAELNGGERPE